MFDHTAYLRNEFLRYYPNSAVSVSENHIDETITVTVDETNVYTMEIGSDDNWYSFTNDLGFVITVPLAPEEA